MPLSPFDVLAPYQTRAKMRRLDHWTELQTTPPVQHALTQDEPLQRVPAVVPAPEPEIVPAVAESVQPEAPISEASVPAAAAPAPELTPTDVPAVQPVLPQPQPQHRFYDQIIRKHTAAAARSVLTPATPRS